MDPLLIPRTSDDAGYRYLLDRLDSLDRRLADVSAMISQVTASSVSDTSPGFTPGASASGTVATVSLSPPGWATSCVALLSGWVTMLSSSTSSLPFEGTLTYRAGAQWSGISLTGLANSHGSTDTIFADSYQFTDMSGTVSATVSYATQDARWTYGTGGVRLVVLWLR